MSRGRVVRQARLELATPCLEDRHSSQLSYYRVKSGIPDGTRTRAVPVKGVCAIRYTTGTKK